MMNSSKQKDGLHPKPSLTKPLELGMLQTQLKQQNAAEQTEIGRLIFYHYCCWRVGGAVPVKISTCNSFPRKYQTMPQNYYQYWC